MRNAERSLRMKTNLAASLRRALEKKPLNRVTVSELIRDCGVNRNTFYYYFEDIYALLRWMMDREAQDITKKIADLPQMEEAIRYVMDYVDDNRHLISCMCGCRTTSAMSLRCSTRAQARHC